MPILSESEAETVAGKAARREEQVEMTEWERDPCSTESQ